MTILISVQKAYFSAFFIEQCITKLVEVHPCFYLNIFNIILKLFYFYLKWSLKVINGLKFSVLHLTQLNTPKDWVRTKQ